MTICIYLSDTWLPWKYVGSCVPINNISYNYTVFHFPLLHFNNVITRVKKKKKKRNVLLSRGTLSPKPIAKPRLKFEIHYFTCGYIISGVVIIISSRIELKKSSEIAASVLLLNLPFRARLN